MSQLGKMPAPLTDRLADGDFPFDDVQETDEFLVAMTLHVVCDPAWKSDPLKSVKTTSPPQATDSYEVRRSSPLNAAL